MTRLIFLLNFLFSLNFYSQSLNLNNTLFENNIRRAQLNGDIDYTISFTLRPIDLNHYDINKDIFDINEYSPTVLSFLNNNGKLKILPLDFNINYSSHHPYNRNNGSMITNRGYQQLISVGIYLEMGPLSIQLKPENIYAENKGYDGFWEGHYDIIWAKRYNLWNNSDLPERFGVYDYKKTTFGQSSVRLNYKSLSLGLSSENIWWGPSVRNGIMMSNNAQGFNHVTFNTRKPIKTFIGNFEFQLVTGRLEPSGFNPPNIDRTYAGTKLFVPKINQNAETGDWRFFQGYTITYSPIWVPGFHVGLNRWAQMYGAMFEGRYNWIADANNGAKVGWFPIFNNFLRKNDKIEPYERETDQAASVFFRWFWKDSKAEIYGDFAHNDSKVNLRDLLLDSDHSRSLTLGLRKLFDSKRNNSQFEFHWEWTQMEQTGSRLIRNAGSWYLHNRVYHGYTNNGEVIGAGIGPGSNSQYFSVANHDKNRRIGLAFEMIDQDNDFYYYAFEQSGDFRRYWKDFNFHLFYEKKFKNFWGSFNMLYSRSLNYQWELIENPALPYYQPGRDVNNLHIDFKLTYPISF
tara:strand:+ start:23738 stop:25456 length:1719 start_codon:yes stop_codon:yes gene_type:complete